MFLKLFIINHIFTCVTDFENDKLLRSEEPKSLFDLPKIISLDISNRLPIRIHFDVSSIDDHTKDSHQCFNNITASSTICQNSDNLSPSIKNSIKETIDNVKLYLEENLNVTRKEGTWTNNAGFHNYEPDTRTLTNIDLYIAVLARPFGAESSGLAYASSNGYNDGVDGRPISGYIVLNPSRVPSTSQNFSSGNRQFITTVLHEINHVLSFSQTLFPRWINPNTNTSYGGDNWKTTYINDYGTTQTFVKGNNLNEWVNERFSVSNSSLINLGLELEDGGGPGTALSHPNQRLYFSDLMQGRTYGPGYLSPILYNTLLDTGWYSPLSSMSEVFAYLDSTLNDATQTNERILIDPPRISFPSNYLCSNSQSSPCFYDHIYTGVCSLTSTKPSWLESEDKWYNPNDSKFYGTDNLLDFTPLILPWINCKDSNSKLKRNYPIEETEETYAEKFSTESICAMSTLYKSPIATTQRFARCIDSFCGTDNKVRLLINDEEFLCRNDGQQIKINGYTGYIECPPSKVVCANRLKRELLNVLSLFPDRGPIDGKNLITINGFGFDNYETNDLIINIGEINCNILQKKDSYILCKLSETPINLRGSLLMNPQKFNGKIISKNITTTLKDMYTFTSRLYSNGLITSKPTILLILLSLIIGYFL